VDLSPIETDYLCIVHQTLLRAHPDHWQKVLGDLWSDKAIGNEKANQLVNLRRDNNKAVRTFV